MGTAEHPLAGRWDLRIRTPIGSLEVVHTFTESAAGLAGTARSAAETVAPEGGCGAASPSRAVLPTVET